MTALPMLSSLPNGAVSRAMQLDPAGNIYLAGSLTRQKGPAVALAPSLDPGPFTGTTVIATTGLPGSITGVAQVQLRAGGAAGENVLLNEPTLAGTPLRERVILIWTRQAYGLSGKSCFFMASGGSPH